MPKSQNRFLTRTFYAFRVDSGNSAIQEWKTYLPYFVHKYYKIPYPLSYQDAYDKLIADGQSSTDAKESLKKGWFTPLQKGQYKDFLNLTLAGSGFYAYETVPSITINGETITINDKRYKGIINTAPSIWSGSNTGAALPAVVQKEGSDYFVLLKIDTAIFGQISPTSKVEISLVLSNTWSPWIYYGLTRSEMSYRLGKDEKGMGGLYPSLTPASGIQFKYFIDGTMSNAFERWPYIPMLPTLYNVPIYQSSMLNEYLTFMFDVISPNPEGDEKVVLRSLTNFNVFQIGQSQQMGMIENTAFRTTLKADAYRNIHYRSMIYNDYNYKMKNDLMDGVTYIFLCEKNTKFSEFYNNFVNSIEFSFDIFAKDMDNDVFVYGYSTGGSLEELGDMYSFGAAGSGGGENSPSFGSIDNNIFSNFYGDYMQGIIDTQISDWASGNITYHPIERTYCIVVLSAFKWGMTEHSESQAAFTASALATYTYDGADEQFSIDVNYYAGSICVSKDDLTKIYENAEDKEGEYAKSIYLGYIQGIVGSNSVIALWEYRGFDCYIFALLRLLLLPTAGTVESDSDLLIKQDYVSIAEIKNQTEMFLSYEINDQDYNNDGKKTLVDRVYGLYKVFNPLKISDNLDNDFFLDLASEMRFWRKLCPIGMLYRIKGKVSGVTEVTYTDKQLESSRWFGLFPSVYFDLETAEGKLKVYVEHGARSNVGKCADGNDIEVQGQLIIGKYFYNIKNSSRTGYMDFTKASEILSWYRLTRESLFYLSKNLNECILFVRSNINIEMASEKDVNRIMFGLTKTFDLVEDYICQALPILDNKELKLQEDASDLLVDYKSDSFATNHTSMPLFSLQFEMEIPDISANKIGRCQYYIEYTKPEETTKRRIYEFYSHLTMSGGSKNRKTITFDLTEDFKCICLAKTLDVAEADLGKVFDICYPYSPPDDGLNQLEIDKRLIFKWDNKIWKIRRVYYGSNILTYAFAGDTNASSRDCIISYDGTLKLNKDPINFTSNIFIKFVNISNLDDASKYDPYNFFSLVKFEKLYIHRGMGGASTDKPPIIRNIKINYGKNRNLERVECRFSNTIIEDLKHLICPTYGYMYLGGASWSFTETAGITNAESAGGVFNTDSTGSMNSKVQGDIISPYFLLDPFAEASDENRLLKSSASNLVSIDRVYGTVAAKTQMVHTKTVYIDISTPPETVKVSTYNSEISNRFTLVYQDKEGILNQKYSFLDFASRYDTGDREKNQNFNFRRTDGRIWNGNMRGSSPIYCNRTRVNIDVNLAGGVESTFNIDSALGKLVGVYVDSANVTVEPQVIGVYSESKPLGYKTFSLQNSVSVSSQRVPVYKGMAYAKLMNTIGETKSITLKAPQPPDGYPGTASILMGKVYGEYIDYYQYGNTPQILETVYGDYYLFFLGGVEGEESNFKSNNKIKMLYSPDGLSWERADHSRHIETGKRAKPITILENNSGFSNLVHLKNSKSSEPYNIMYYNNDSNSVEMLCLPKTYLDQIHFGYDETKEEPAPDPGNNLYIDEQRQIFSSNLQIVAGATVVKNWNEMMNTGKYVVTVLNGTLHNFTSVRSLSGISYLAYITETDGELRLMVSSSPGNDQTPLSQTWVDSGYNFSDSKSNLGKFLSGEEIKYITISSHYTNTEQLSLFISTADKLVVFAFPMSFVLYLMNLRQIGVDLKKDLPGEMQKILKDIYSRKPNLVIGRDVDNDNLNKGVYMNENFKPQMVAVESLNDGNYILAYYDINKNVSAIKSANLEYWYHHINV